MRTKYSPEDFATIQQIKKEKQSVHKQYQAVFGEMDRIWQRDVKRAIPMDSSKRVMEKERGWGNVGLVEDVSWATPVFEPSPEFLNLRKKEEYLENQSKKLSLRLRVIYRKYNKVY